LIFAQAATTGRARSPKLVTSIETVLKAGIGVLLFVWLAMLLPTEGTARWLLLASALIALAAIFILRRRLIYWHSHLEVELQMVMNSAEHKMTGTSAPWLKPHEDWDLHIVDCVLPDLADVQGRKIAELDLRAKYGCSVVGIERQGFMIPVPPPDAVVYPRDRVLLMGTTAQIQSGKEALSAVSGTAGSESIFEEVQMQALVVPEWSRAVGKSLGTLALAQVFGVQVAGINRRGVRVLNPSADEVLGAGDSLLVLGSQEQIRGFNEWLREQPGEEQEETVA